MLSDYDKKSIEKIQVETGADLRTAIQSYRENNNDCEKVLMRHWIRCIRIETGVTEEIAGKYYEEDHHDFKKAIEDIKEAMKPKVTDESTNNIGQEQKDSPIFQELTDVIEKYGYRIADISGSFFLWI